MGLVDKFKKILFDEEEIEVPVGNDELPERPSKKIKNSKVEKKGFIDYHHDDSFEEDTIKEVVVPKDEPAKNNFNFPVDIDFETELRSRSRYRDEPTGEIKLVRKDSEELAREEKRQDFFEESPIDRDLYEMPKPREKVLTAVSQKTAKVPEQPKDYHKLIEDKPSKDEHKPFKATPIISPVYGILDKNYTAEDLVNKKPIKREVPVPNEKTRTFGPVSFNDQPLPMKKTKEVVVVSRTVEDVKHEEKTEPVEEKEPLKEDLHELNSTINELITDTVQARDVEDVEPVINERVKKYAEPISSDEPEIDDGIEEEYVAHNDIEDAFDSTSEFDEDMNVKKNSTVKNDENTDVEDLSNTIETDLFNLIDSMYRSNEDDDKEEESA